MEQSYFEILKHCNRKRKGHFQVENDQQNKNINIFSSILDRFDEGLEKFGNFLNKKKFECNYLYLI